MAEPVGSLIDALGVTHCPEQGELITDAVVLLKVVDEHGRVILRTLHSEGMSWIECIGMLTAAQAQELRGLRGEE